MAPSEQTVVEKDRCALWMKTNVDQNPVDYVLARYLRLILFCFSHLNDRDASPFHRCRVFYCSSIDQLYVYVCASHTHTKWAKQCDHHRHRRQIICFRLSHLHRTVVAIFGFTPIKQSIRVWNT